MSKTTRRRYTAEFKAEAVGLVTQQGYGVADAARALGINRSLLDRWVRMERDRQDPEKAPQGRDAELEEWLGCPVHIVRLRPAMNASLRERILPEARYV